MNKKLLWLALIVLAIPTFVFAQSAFIWLRQFKPKRKPNLVTRWKRRRAQQREAQEFYGYFQVVIRQLQADMEIGRRAMQRAGVWDENGDLTEKYRDFDSSWCCTLGSP